MKLKNAGLQLLKWADENGTMYFGAAETTHISWKCT